MPPNARPVNGPARLITRSRPGGSPPESSSRRPAHRVDHDRRLVPVEPERHRVPHLVDRQRQQHDHDPGEQQPPPHDRDLHVCRTPAHPRRARTTGRSGWDPTQREVQATTQHRQRRRRPPPSTEPAPAPHPPRSRWGGRDPCSRRSAPIPRQWVGARPQFCAVLHPPRGGGCAGPQFCAVLHPPRGGGGAGPRFWAVRTQVRTQGCGSASARSTPRGAGVTRRGGRLGSARSRAHRDVSQDAVRVIAELGRVVQLRSQPPAEDSRQRTRSVSKTWSSWW